MKAEQRAQEILTRDARDYECKIDDYCSEIAKSKGAKMRSMCDLLMRTSVGYEVVSEVLADLAKAKSVADCIGIVQRRIVFAIDGLTPEPAGAIAHAMRVRRLQALRGIEDTLRSVQASYAE